MVRAIVVNYNAGTWLKRCIASVLQSDQIASCHVIDNYSNDGSVASLDQLADTRLQIRELPENLGFGSAVNIGASDAEETYLLILNPDAQMPHEALQALTDYLDKHPQTAIAAPLVCNMDGTTQRAARRREPTVWRALMTFTGLERFSGNLPVLQGINMTDDALSEPHTVDAVSGAAFVVRRLVFEQVKGFDPDFFLHAEDLDLFKRIRLSGGQIVCLPNVHVVHEKGVSHKSVALLAARAKRDGLLRYYRKHIKPNAFVGWRWLWPAAVWTRFLVDRFRLS